MTITNQSWKLTELQRRYQRVENLLSKISPEQLEKLKLQQRERER